MSCMGMGTMIMKTEHHEQRVDFENGYVVAKREDTAGYQDLCIEEYTDAGRLYKKTRLLYNIQYDYLRQQVWRDKTNISDYIEGMDRYGHLQYEYGAYPPEGWVNPYPDNHELVRPEGADIFHTEGLSFNIYFGWVHHSASVNIYIRDDLDEFHRPIMENLITQIEPAPPWYIQKYQDYEKNEAKKFVNFDRVQARKKRMEALRKHGRKIGVDIPIDPRFID